MTIKNKTSLQNISSENRKAIIEVKRIALTDHKLTDKQKLFLLRIKEQQESIQLLMAHLFQS